MLICSNCNKEYDDNETLRVCPFCGGELIEKNEEAPVIAEAVTEEAVTEEAAAEKSTEEKKCSKCGSIVLSGENFCIRCGTPVNSAETSQKNGNMLSECDSPLSLKERLQEILNDIFNLNKISQFLYKYAFIFVFIYPVSLIVCRFFSNDFSEVLNQISNITFYLYYIGLFALYAKKNYLFMLIAVFLRALNPVFAMIQTNLSFAHVSKLAIMAVFLFCLFKEFSETQQYRDILAKLKIDIITCPNCNSKISKSSSFCSKCGYKKEDII